MGHLPSPIAINVPGEAVHVSGAMKLSDCETRQTWVQILTPPPISCVTLGQILTFSVPQFLDRVTM